MTFTSASSCLRRAGLFASVQILFATVLWAGEKIEFSGATKTELPKAGARESVTVPENYLNSSKNNAESDFQSIAPRPQIPNAAGRKKLEEYLDRKKNWLFTTEKQKDTTPSIAEMFGVRETHLDGSDDKPKKVVDEFLSDRGNKRNFGDRRERGPEDKAEAFARRNDRRGSDPDEDDPNNPSGGIAELNLNRLIHPTDNAGVSEIANDMRKTRFEGFQLNGAVNSSLKDTDRQKQEDARSEGFRQMLQSKTPRPTSDGRLDPINSQSDGTRREMNPITGRRPDPISSFGSLEPRVDPIRAFSSGIAPGPSIADSLGQQGSSLSPAIMAPFSPPPARMETRPAPVLDFQKRRF